MPSERTRAALSDIIRNIDLAESFCHGLTPNQFMADVKVFYATTRALEIISEASRRLPGALKDRHADVPWRAIADAGNIYRHGYDILVGDVLWQTVQTGFATRRRAAQSELNRKSED
jgi:uncharacterized protein with HEPN domain